MYAGSFFEVVVLALLLLAAPLTAVFGSPAPLADPVPRLDGLTGASDLLYRPVLGAPIPPRVLPGQEADVLRERFRERRKDEAPRTPTSPARNEPRKPTPRASTGGADYS